jgi:predicted transcriptional regulator/CBS domain-containing protein
MSSSPVSIPTLIQIPNPFVPFLLSTITSQVSPQTPIVSIDVYDKISKLESLFRETSLHSVPVLENGSCIGMVDGLNLVSFFLQNPQEYSKRAQKTTLLSLLVQTTTPLPVFSTTSLLDVISIVAPGVHRAIVLNSESNHSLFSVCSESDIIAAIYSFGKMCEPLKKNNLPIFMVNSIPIRAFSNYFAHLKFTIDSTQDMKAGVKSLTDALLCTTVQGSPQAVAAAVVVPGSDSGVDEQAVGGIGDAHGGGIGCVGNGHDHKNAVSNASYPLQIIPLTSPEKAHTSLQWNAPVVVVVKGGNIVSFLTTDTFHNAIVVSTPHCNDGHNNNTNAITDQSSDMGRNFDKSIEDYLTSLNNLPNGKNNSPNNTFYADSFSNLPRYNPVQELELGYRITDSNLVRKNPLGAPIGVIIHEEIKFGDLLELFALNKLDYVWVSSCVPETIQIVEEIPLEWFHKKAIGLVTINDLLRLISRDNLAIYQDFLPNDGVE